ncbi:MAG: hypothetical protein WAQ98_02645 [Blastocatellia bacterium]
MCTNLPLPTNQSTIGDEEIEINAVFIRWRNNKKFSHYEVTDFGEEVYAFYHGVDEHFTDSNILNELLYLGYKLIITRVTSDVSLGYFMDFNPNEEIKHKETL